MAQKTYHGSCHCKRVRFEADIDLSAGTGKCNCSYCWKARGWTVGLKPNQVRVVAGKEHTTEYGFQPDSVNFHVFCKHCGIRLYTYGNVPEIGGEYVSVALPALDDLAPAELAGAPVQYMNGRDDDWFHEPAEKRHL